MAFFLSILLNLNCSNVWLIGIKELKIISLLIVSILILRKRSILFVIINLSLNSQVLTHKFWFTGNLLLKCFLLGRNQQVVVNHSLSDPSEVLSGVPQGSVLGPILFLLFISDISNYIDPTCVCKIFADDLKVYHTRQRTYHVNHLQRTLDEIIQWAKTWQLSIAVPKCSVLYVGNNNPHLSNILAGVLILEQNDVRDLGVQISSNLSFVCHITNVVNKSSRLVNMIFRCFTHKSWKHLLRACVCYVRPMLEYCCSVWSPHASLLA